jgi:hypothetical protein
MCWAAQPSLQLVDRRLIRNDIDSATTVERPERDKSRQTSAIRKGSIAPIPARRPPGLAGAMITEYPLVHRRYDGSEYEPFWAAAAALDLPLSLHTATRRQAGSAGPVPERCATPAAARQRRSIRRCRCAT